MTRGKLEAEGDLATFIIQGVTLGRVSPDKILSRKDLNPFRECQEVSEAMRKHLEGIESEKWRTLVKGLHNAGR